MTDGCFRDQRIGFRQDLKPHVLYQPWMNKPQTAVEKMADTIWYHGLSLWGVAPIVDKPWFIKPGLILNDINGNIYQ